MSQAQIIDGKELARLEREGIADRAEAVRAAGGTVSLDAVLVEATMRAVAPGDVVVRQGDAASAFGLVSADHSTVAPSAIAVAIAIVSSAPGATSGGSATAPSTRGPSTMLGVSNGVPSQPSSRSTSIEATRFIESSPGSRSTG